MTTLSPTPVSNGAPEHVAPARARGRGYEPAGRTSYLDEDESRHRVVCSRRPARPSCLPMWWKTPVSSKQRTNSQPVLTWNQRYWDPEEAIRRAATYSRKQQLAQRSWTWAATAKPVVEEQATRDRSDPPGCPGLMTT